MYSGQRTYRTGNAGYITSLVLMLPFDEISFWKIIVSPLTVTKSHAPKIWRKESVMMSAYLVLTFDAWATTFLSSAAALLTALS
jgi:hypothetical protein